MVSLSLTEIIIIRLTVSLLPFDDADCDRSIRDAERRDLMSTLESQNELIQAGKARVMEKMANFKSMVTRVSELKQSLMAREPPMSLMSSSSKRYSSKQQSRETPTHISTVVSSGTVDDESFFSPSAKQDLFEDLEASMSGTVIAEDRKSE